jgi:hypothetical protein
MTSTATTCSHQQHRCPMGAQTLASATKTYGERSTIFGDWSCWPEANINWLIFVLSCALIARFGFGLIICTKGWFGLGIAPCSKLGYGIGIGKGPAGIVFTSGKPGVLLNAGMITSVYLGVSPRHRSGAQCTDITTVAIQVLPRAQRGLKLCLACRRCRFRRDGNPESTFRPVRTAQKRAAFLTAIARVPACSKPPARPGSPAWRRIRSTSSRHFASFSRAFVCPHALSSVIPPAMTDGG